MTGASSWVNVLVRTYVCTWMCFALPWKNMLSTACRLLSRADFFPLPFYHAALVSAAATPVQSAAFWSLPSRATFIQTCFTYSLFCNSFFFFLIMCNVKRKYEGQVVLKKTVDKSIMAAKVNALSHLFQMWSNENTHAKIDIWLWP